MQQNIAKTVIHSILRTWIKCTTYFFFEKVIVSGKENIPADGPIILASNHPNSFLDPLLITSYYKRPIYYIARGDVFSTKLASAILRSINIIPIYRREEGAEHFPKNADTFAFCIKAFKKNGTVLIFSEGQSENEWELRPLRKGTARLTDEAWHNHDLNNIMQVLPVGINYSSWLQINCRAYLSFAKIITKDDFPGENEQGLFLRKFNELLKNTFQENCVVIDPEKHVELQKILVGFLLKNIANGKELAIQIIEQLRMGSEEKKENILLFANHLKANRIEYFQTGNVVSFLIGIILYYLACAFNFIPYTICQYIAKRTTRFNEFYDSVLYCSLLFLYPFYLIALFITTHLVTDSWLCALFIIGITLLTAKLHEWARRNIYCFLHKKQIRTISTMLSGLFEKDNG